ncbi:MAG: biotin carboxylase N-terminal domain-containing protein [Bdellovibrionota bacterium]
MIHAKAAKKTVLIANRGEISIRIARTCRKLGFEPVAVYSDADRFAEHVKYCGKACWIGGASPKDSYLNVERVLDAARASGAGFIHPGYGFLSEQTHFAEACIKEGLVFVGPSAKSMKLMGNKISARSIVDGLGIPRVPGSVGAVSSAGEAKKIAQEIGFPILLKAASGGGGKGMRRVDKSKDIEPAFDGASREALGAFGDGSLYLEKLILEPHHVEVQIFGDGKGGAIHLGERECSIQRRHQKILEETPSPILEKFPKTRERMFDAAVKIASSIDYASAGTIEFIVNGRGDFYFLEMNTRLQVEHPITEWVTGIDLVAWQLDLASNKFDLPATVDRKGHSIEVRLYAEDPFTFLPAPGQIGAIRLPSGEFVRVDSAFTEAGEVSIHYDPMIAKISVWAPDRASAIQRLRVALDDTSVVSGKDGNGFRSGSLRTNLSFIGRLVRNADFVTGETPTDLIQRNPSLTASNDALSDVSVSMEAAVATSLVQLLQEGGDLNESAANAAGVVSNWSATSRREGVSS